MDEGSYSRISYFRHGCQKLESRNFVSLSSLTDLKCVLQKIKKNAVLVYGHVYIIMVILRSQNKITDFLMILAWACPFKSCTESPFIVWCCMVVIFIIRPPPLASKVSLVPLEWVAPTTLWLLADYIEQREFAITLNLRLSVVVFVPYAYFANVNFHVLMGL